MGEAKDAVVVPEQAVVETQAGPTVYTVDCAGQGGLPPPSGRRSRTTASASLDSGVEPGQSVVVEGLQLVRPGITVKAEAARARRAAPGDSPPRPPTATKGTPGEDGPREPGP